MVAPEVASLIVTVCAMVYVPPKGVKVGVGREGAIVYADVAAALLVYPAFTAIAVSVSVALTVIAPVYAVEDVVGVVPLVV